MSRSTRSAALARTATTNMRRLVIVIGFMGAVLLLRALGTPVPDEVLGGFIAYIAAVALNQRILRRELTLSWLNRIQLFTLLLDITFLTAMYLAFGAMWWMGSAIYSVIATAAFASLPRRRAWIVAGYAFVAFVGGILAHTASLVPSWSILGAPSIAGNYTLAFAVALFGAAAIVTGVYIQLTFTRIIRHSEGRSRLIIRAAPEMILTTNACGLITSANESTVFLTGRGYDELVNRSFVDLLHEEDRAMSVAAIQANLADGISRSFDARYETSQDEVRWLRCSCNRFAGENSANEVVILASDITDRVRDREAIQAREALLAATESVAQIGSWEWDLRKGALTWSAELYRMLGVQPNGPLSIEDFLARVHPDDAETVRRMYRRILQKGTPFAHDFRIIGEGDVIRVLHGIGRVIMDDSGSAIGVIGSIQDITEQSNLTEQLRQAQKMEALGRLAGGIAHDFNNVLTVIKTYSEFLLGSLADRAVDRADVEEINKAADKAACLTKQLLVFSKGHEARLQTVDLNQCIEKLESMLNRLVGDNIQIQSDLAKDACRVRADPGQIEQVLMNLVVNACDAMPAGGSVTIATTNSVLRNAAISGEMLNGSFAVLSVSDTGHGMTHQTRARIFDPFFTTKPAGKGTGLGLSIVYGIVQQSNGHIEAESEVDGGTTFKIYLPSTDGEIEQEAQATAFMRARHGNETILLVEDENALRAALGRSLHIAGYTVIDAEDGEKAIAILNDRRGEIDMILTDMSMPVMGGKELAVQVRRTDTRIPILFMSGYTEEGSEVTWESPASAILRKPFATDVLLQRVRSLLDEPPVVRFTPPEARRNPETTLQGRDGSWLLPSVA